MNNDRFLRLTGTQWTVVFGIIALFAWRYPVSAPSQTSQPISAAQSSSQKGSSTPAPIVASTKAPDLSINKVKVPIKIIHSSHPENTLQEKQNKEEIFKTIRNFYTEFNRVINNNMDENEKIESAYSNFFDTKYSSEQDAYERFQKFMKSIIDRDITFTVTNLTNMSTTEDKKYHKVIIDGIYTWEEQFRPSNEKFTQILISENGKDWKLHGWLQNTSN